MQRGEVKQFGKPQTPELLLAILQYGHSDWTINMLNSVVSKNWKLQVVVLDQGSGSSDWARILSYQRSHPDLTVLRSPMNLGIPEGWNTIIRFCLEYCDRVLVAPNDILYRHDTIDVLMEAWKNKPFENVVSVSSIWMGKKRDNTFEQFQNETFRSTRAWSWTGFNGLITKEFVEKVGWYDENLGPWWWNDTDMLFRIFKTGHIGMVVHDSRVWLTEHSTKRESIEKAELSRIYARNMIRFAEKHSLNVDNIHEEKQWQYHYAVTKDGKVVPKEKK